MTRQMALRVAHVRAIQLTDAIVREAGPGADGLGARLVAQEAQRQLHARPLAAVTIVADAHGERPSKFLPRPFWCKPAKTQSINLVKNTRLYTLQTLILSP